MPSIGARTAAVFVNHQNFIDRDRRGGDVDPAALQAHGLSGQDIANALANQNLITPVGTAKIGTFEYPIQLNNAPSAIAALGDLPIKAVNGAGAAERLGRKTGPLLGQCPRASFNVFK